MKISLAIFASFFLINSIVGHASLSPKFNNVKYKTSFGQCPSRVAGKLTIKLMKHFEKTGSLKSIKEKIISDGLGDKHFLSKYEISYDPLRRLIKFNFDCPEPLMKVQIYKKDSVDNYDAILVENGKLFDPTYEVMLKAEKKLKGNLPFLAIPIGQLEEEQQMAITHIVKNLDSSYRKILSELILDEKGSLTIILSISGNPTSIFFGEDYWDVKMKKLRKIVSYMRKRGRVPAIINLTNAKKVVVKFTD